MTSTKYPTRLAPAIRAVALLSVLLPIACQSETAALAEEQAEIKPPAPVASQVAPTDPSVSVDDRVASLVHATAAGSTGTKESYEEHLAGLRRSPMEGAAAIRAAFKNPRFLRDRYSLIHALGTVASDEDSATFLRDLASERNQPVEEEAHMEYDMQKLAVVRAAEGLSAAQPNGARTALVESMKAESITVRVAAAKAYRRSAASLGLTTEQAAADISAHLSDEDLAVLALPEVDPNTVGPEKPQGY